jgi:hypothetical protein
MVPDPEAGAPDPEAMAPDPEAMAPDPKAVAPDPKAMAPDPKAMAPDPKAMAPDPKAVAPDPKAMAPDPKAMAPDPKAMAPDPTWRNCHIAAIPRRQNALYQNGKQGYYEYSYERKHFMLTRFIKPANREVVMNRDIFSIGEAEFLTFATNFNTATATHADALGIPRVLIMNNSSGLSNYTTAYHDAKAPNAGSLDREHRKAMRGELTETMHKIKNAYLDANPLGAVTPEILRDFGLRPKDDIRTDVPDPTEVVPFTLESGEYLQVIVKHPACPPNYTGAVAFYKVGGPRPRKPQRADQQQTAHPPEGDTLLRGHPTGPDALHLPLLGEREGPAGPAFADTEPRDGVSGSTTALRLCFRTRCRHGRYIRRSSYIPQL